MPKYSITKAPPKPTTPVGWGISRAPIASPTPAPQPTPTPKPSPKPYATISVATPSGPLTTPKVSTTTISNSNKIDQVPGIIEKTTTLADRGVRTDPATGVATLANGQVAPPTDERDAQGLLINPAGALYDRNTGKPIKQQKTTKTTTPTDPGLGEEDAAIESNINKMQSITDGVTASILESIKQKFSQRKTEQKDINMRQQKGITNALLMGGATGQGSSAQYAPISSEGILAAQENYGLQQLADLDAQEQDLINDALVAKANNNFKILEEKNKQIETKRQEKIDYANKLNEEIAERNRTTREKNMQATRDSAIADLYGQGITDVSGMLDMLNYDENGNRIGDFTSKEISDTLKNIVPPGLDDLVKTLRTNGAPSDVIKKVLTSPNMNAAYENAGGYAAGGTGIVGEYNFYKAQALAAGQVPVDFNTYQNMDANRKIRIATAANAAGLTTAAMNTALKLSDDYEARSKDFFSQREAYNRVISSASDPSPAGDLSLIFNYMKVLDPNSTVREGEFATAQNAGSAWSILGAKYNKVVNGERLTETQRKDFVDRVGKLFNGAKTQQDSINKEYEDRATKYGVPGDLVVRKTDATGSNAADLIQTSAQAKNKIDSIFDSLSPEIQDLIISSYDNDLDDITIYNQLVSKGLIK